MSNNLSHKNNFDLFKLIFSSLVVVSHCSILSKTPYPKTWFPQVVSPIGQVAVWGFFVMSGYLVSGSLDRSKNRIQFLLKRFYRIYPAHILSAFLASFVLGAFLTSLHLKDYFSNGSAYLHFINAFFLIPKEDCLNGVFSNNPYNCAVNGNLWTLRYEILFYMMLCLLFSFSFTKKRKFIIAATIFFFIAYYCWYFLDGKIVSPELNYHFKHFVQLAIYFFLGVFFYYVPVINSKICKKIFLLCLPVFILCWFDSGNIYSLSMPVLVPVIIISGGLWNFSKINIVAIFGDVSYGVYIYGFTIQQAILQLFPNIGIYTFLITSIIACFAVGYVSWHFVEKRWLNRK
jgi:peptidoglycan/LPS O-acetylase OafA/YrhL